MMEGRKRMIWGGGVEGGEEEEWEERDGGVWTMNNLQLI